MKVTWLTNFSENHHTEVMDMKRYIVVIGFALTLAGLPLLSWGGSYTPGTVTVSGNSMNGAFNVRFNAATGTNGYIMLNAGPAQTGGSGIIMAQDSNTGTYFICMIPNTDALYGTLEKLVYGSKDGVAISVFKNSSGKCTDIDTTNASNRLH
jgi:hypothetical protein